jgi:hypothetical protein
MRVAEKLDWKGLILLKLTDAPKEVYDILGLTVSFKFINFSFRLFLLFVTKMSASLMACIIQIICITLVWIL